MRLEDCWKHDTFVIAVFIEETLVVIRCWIINRQTHVKPAAPPLTTGSHFLVYVN